MLLFDLWPGELMLAVCRKCVLCILSHLNCDSELYTHTYDHAILALYGSDLISHAKFNSPGNRMIANARNT